MRHNYGHNARMSGLRNAMGGTAEELKTSLDEIENMNTRQANALTDEIKALDPKDGPAWVEAHWDLSDLAYIPEAYSYVLKLRARKAFLDAHAQLAEIKVDYRPGEYMTGNN